MLSNVWRFHDSVSEPLYSKRSRGTVLGPIERQPARQIANAQTERMIVFRMVLGWIKFTGHLFPMDMLSESWI